jgi:hypothetical protein
MCCILRIQSLEEACYQINMHVFTPLPIRTAEETVSLGAKSLAMNGIGSTA